MNVKIISDNNGAYSCVIAARMSARAKDPEHALKTALESHHESILEHAVYTFLIEGISRVCLAQLCRHRFMSMTVESQRYTDSGKNEFVIPESLRNFRFYSENDGTLDIREVNDTLVDLYEELVESGIPREDARFILPQSITTNLVLTTNARELRHFFNLRCCKRAQWEIRELANQMLKLCKERDPILFDGDFPNCGYCPEKHPCKKVVENAES